MKTQRQHIKSVSGLLIVATFLSLTSCRSTDTDQTLTGGVASVKINLTGTDFAGVTGVAQASLKSNIATNEVQRHGAMLSPSMILEAELKPSSEKISGQASVKENTLAAVSGDPIGSGMKFRVIAYRQGDGSYQDYKDYTVGQPVEGLTLDMGAAYNIIAYSYGKTTLPAITAGEMTSINNTTLNYNYLTNKDFMYQKQPYTPVAATNILPLTLRHKLTLITTTVTSYIGNINSITNANITPTYAKGTIDLSTGKITYTGTSGSIGLNFPGGDAMSKTAAPVLVSSDSGGALLGDFTASIGVNGAASKVLTLTNAFKITPEYKSDLIVNLRTCGAYLGANQTQWTEFACQNVGATAGIDPFSPVSGNHGSKIQFGRNITGTNGVYYYTQASDQANSGTIAGWNITAASNGAWNSGTEAKPVKTANDPCSSGYRIPTNTEWQAVIANNNVERISTTGWASSPANYDSALYFKNNNVRTLMLPAGGDRDSGDGHLNARGNAGVYWSVTPNTTAGSPNAFSLAFTGSNITTGENSRTFGFSVRCIKDNTSSAVNGGSTSWNSSGSLNVTTTF